MWVPRSIQADHDAGAEGVSEPPAVPPAEGRDRLKKLQSECSNALETVTSLMTDRSLQLSARMLVEAASPLRDEYLATLETHGMGQAAVAQWQAERSMSTLRVRGPVLKSSGCETPKVCEELFALLCT